MNVYFISGLAADNSIFRQLVLPAPCRIIYLDWMSPLPNETLALYALRMAEKIDFREPFSLVGLSLGGMIATELANRFQPQTTVLISSIPSIRHLPVYYHYAGRLQLHTVLPVSLIQKASLLKRLFTNETPEDKELLKGMIRRSDAAFIKWAMQAVLSWQNTKIPDNLIHIHGTKDEILPLRFTKPTHKILNGKHLMVLNRAAEINAILNDVFVKNAVLENVAS